MSGGMSIADLSPAPPAPGVSPQQAVDGITRAAKSSFALGIRLLARPRRAAMRAVYAFCRVVDDIADGTLAPEEKRALLDDWRAEIGRVYAGTAVSAIGQALAGPVAEYDLPKAEFLRMIDGMEIDANGPVVAPTRAELAEYVRCVAGTVGLLSMRVFGAWRGQVSEDFALALAEALQLTNILRDVEEDAGIGRIYLPAEHLATAGIPADPARIAGHPGLPDARGLLGAEARAAFGRAHARIAAHDRTALAPALAMYGVYRALLGRMEAAGWRHGPAMRMGRMAKLYHGLSAAAGRVRA